MASSDTGSDVVEAENETEDENEAVAAAAAVEETELAYREVLMPDGSKAYLQHGAQDGRFTA